jgi:UDP-N-acetylglucosamine 2-epimerase (non-hydrolysing)
MQRIKVLSTFGTRPEANKMVPLIKALEANDKIESIVAVTAQHRELLDQVLVPFGVKPAYDLNIMTAGQSLTDIVCRVVKGMESVLNEAKPDILLVHGDTATTFAAALAAFYARVKVGHVEAGLRSYDKYQPYPEEMNRKLTTQLTDLFFAPTEDARGKLLKENVPAENIYVTGNTAIDLFKYTLRDGYAFHNDALSRLDESKRLILMTAHRYENRGEAFENICRAVLRLVDAFADVRVVWPMHPNPAVTEVANRHLGGHPRVTLTQAVDVFDMHHLIKRCYLVLTDSGGLQEEAPRLNKPVVVMREVTERPEGLAAGTLKLAGVGEERIYETVAWLLNDRVEYERMANAPNPFGDGWASERIIEALLRHFGSN